MTTTSIGLNHHRLAQHVRYSAKKLRGKKASFYADDVESCWLATMENKDVIESSVIRRMVH